MILYSVPYLMKYAVLIMPGKAKHVNSTAKTMVTANIAFSCSLCDVFLQPVQRRNVFSSSSEFVCHF